MKKLNCILLVMALAISTAATAQPNLDSLWGVWNDKAQPDTSRLKAMNKIAWDGYLFSLPDSAFYFAQLQYDLAEKRGLKKQMGLALNAQGVSFALRGDNPKALGYYQKCLNIYEEIGDRSATGIAATLGNIGHMYYSVGDYIKALDHFQRCLNIMEETGDKNGIAYSLGNIGTIYQDQGDYPKALDCFQRCLKIVEETGDIRGIASTLSNIGNLYQYQGDYPRSLDYYQRSIKVRKKIGDKKGIALSLGNVGSIYRNQGDYPKALDYYQRSIKIREEIGDKSGIAFCLDNIGRIYQNQGHYPKALDYYQSSIKIREKIGDKAGIASCLNNIGSLYQGQGDHQKAINECRKGLLLAQEIGAVLLQRDAYKCLYEAYKTTGNGNKALEYHEQMLALDNSLNAEETGKKLQQMEFDKQMLADSLEQEEEKLRVQMANDEMIRKESRNRNIAIAAAIVLLLLAGGFFSRWRYVRKSRDIISKERDRSDNLLLNILPAEIAEELKQKGEAAARDFELVSILFTDFKGFTQASEKLSATDLVAEINTCFKAFDGIVGKYNIEKIKTIGDAYMCAGGLPVPDENSVKNTVYAGIEMQAFMQARKTERDAAGLPAFEMRVGIHTGPVVAGIVGVKKFQYDIWGDTVNTASRMESSGEVGQVNISEATYELLRGVKEVRDGSEVPAFTFTPRGKVEAKGKGEMEMYFVSPSLA